MPDPIYQRLPETQRALENKAQRNPTLYSGVPSPISTALQQLDIDRVSRGQNPLSLRQSVLALQAATTNQAATKPPDKGFLGNVVSDIRAITASIPRLPAAIYQEVRDLPAAPGQVSEALEAGKIGDVFQAPGIRMLPGAFLAGNIFGGTPEELARHPVFTALDVLPAKQIPAVKKGIGKGVDLARPAITPAARALGRTRPGQLVRETFGTTARDVSQLEATLSEKLRKALDPSAPPSTDPLINVAKRANSLRERFPTIPETRRVELTRLMQEDADAIRTLSGDELAFVNESRSVAEELGRHGVSEGLLELVDGEFYLPRDAARLLRARRKATTANDFAATRTAIENSSPLTPGRVTFPYKDITYNPQTRNYGPGPLYGKTVAVDLPPVESGLKRVYHMSEVDTPSGAFADQPLGMFGRLMSYLDLPEEVLAQYRLSNGTYFITDKALQRTAKSVDPKSYLLDVDVPNPRRILDAAESITHRTDLKPGGKLKLIEGYAHALESAGYSADSLFTFIRQARKPGGYTDSAMRQTLSGYSPVTRATPLVQDLVSRYQPLTRTDPVVARMVDAFKAGRYKDAKGVAKRLATRTKFAIPGIDEAIERAGIEQRKAAYLADTKKYDVKKAQKATARADKVYRRTPPARFGGRIDADIQTNLEQRFSTHPDFDKILPHLRERNYGFLSREGYITDAEFKTLRNDVKSTWADLKAAGYDPVFVHRISPSQTGALAYPRVLEVIPRPTSTRPRPQDTTPYINDISIALPHQALEWLAMRGSEEFIDNIVRRWGRTEGDLIDQYLPAARIRAKFDTRLDVMGHARELMMKEWQRYEPGSIITWPRIRAASFDQSDTLLPRTVSNTIQRMHTPPSGRLTAIFDPVMKVFRTSLLPLSPRWHLYNIMGGGIVTTLRTSPLVFRHMKQAIDMVRAGDMPEGLPHGMGTVPREILEWNERAKFPDRVGATFQFMAGKTMRKLWEQSATVRDAAGKVIQKSYDANSFIDDMYRTMAYLYGQDKALTKGMTKDAARTAGVELSRKVLQNWDRMTPIERSIMRYVFPFYGWMAHILRYTMTYPIDHPYRTAILAAFGRNEMSDMGDALPERFLNMFFLGEPGPDGNVKSINLAGMNPFADVANYFTLAGFMGQLNPILSATLESVGVDPSSGGPELFPNLRYDPSVGRLAVDTGNPLEKFVTATLPQSRILFGFMDRSSEFQELLRHDPDAAARLLRSQAGFPVVFRNVNVPQEIAKAEVARDEAQSTALNTSLRSGDWGAASKFPNLRPILDQLKALQEAGQLEGYEPTMTEGQTNIGVAQEALLRMNAP